ncbi:hypothetical protein ACP4OV_017828 [Aristida adscensionis]
MSPAKVAFVLLLVCAVISTHQVMGKKTPCTKEEKKEILHACEEYIKHGDPVEDPPIYGPCCAAALEVPNLHMPCIVSLLTAKEKKEHDESKILHLSQVCNPMSSPPPPPPDQRHGVMDLKNVITNQEFE